MSPLDFKDIATWKKIDLITACGRISGPLPGTLKVAIHVFHTLKDDAESRGQFFLNCETSGLVEDSLWDAYKEYCKGDIPKLITCMLKCDEAMLQAVKSKDAK